jgi:4-hydroxybenzoate polyprenyltransferase
LVEKYRRGLLVTEVLALAGYELLLAVLIWSSSVPPIPWLLLGQLPLGILFAYGSLKRYPTFDSIAVGTTWAFVIVFSVLLSTAPRPITIDVGTVFAAWVLIVFAGVESRNLQDVEGDEKTDKTTLAGHLGARKTRALEATLKTTGVVVFWSVAGAVVAALVVAYLLLLRLFRQITRREIARAGR